jgi:hypothetical protein
MSVGSIERYDDEDGCNCVNCRLARLEKSIQILSANIEELVEHSRGGHPLKAKGKA